MCELNGTALRERLNRDLQSRLVPLSAGTRGQKPILNSNRHRGNATSTG